MIDVTQFGARPGAASAQTASIQAAIDAAGAAGGGTVVVPAGRFPTSTLRLRERVTLHLESGAVLVGSAHLADYPPLAGDFTDAIGQRRGRCLVYAEGVNGAGLAGAGTIDGQGDRFGYLADDRPFLVRFVDCRDVRLSGVRLQNAAGWVTHLLGCTQVLVQGVTIHSHGNGNNDGLDIDSCRQVRILGCDIDTGDDAICLKSTRATPCEDIVVTGCVLRSGWAALKVGTESAGDFRNVIFSDCLIRDTAGGGLKLISMDGGRMEQIHVSNLILDQVSGPIFLRLGSRLRRYHADQPVRPTGTMRHLSIRNLTVRVGETGSPLYGRHERKAGIIITGVPGHCIEDVTLENLTITFPGGGTAAMAARHDVPEQEAEYPEFPMFHPLPAWAFYLRHVRGLQLRNVELRTESADLRPAIFTEDVEGLRLDGVTIAGQPLGPADLTHRG